MDLTPSLRRKQGTVTYGKRSRTPGTSAHSSPSVARSSFAANVTSSSSLSSDDDDHDHDQEAGSSDPTSRRNVATIIRSPSSSTAPASEITPKHQTAPRSPPIDHVSPLSRTNGTPLPNRSLNKTSATTRSAGPSTSRAALMSRSASSATPGLFPKPSPSSAGLSSTKSLPQRPARATSPTASKSQRPPVKRSASSSPRKLATSVSPTKRQPRSRTPSRPAQDLASLFDAIGPTLPQPRNPFARSESQPIVHLHRTDAEVSLATEPVFAPSPLQSSTLPALELDHAGDQPVRDASLSPSKRPRMADRMGLRAARPTKSKVDEIAEALTNSRRGSLRRTETAPSALSEAGSLAPLPTDAAQHPKEDDSRSARQSEAASSRFETASQADSQSQDGAHLTSNARRLAGIKQTSASNAKRTYGLQRSFLADQAEDHLFSETAGPSTSAVEPRNIEDEIEAELKSNGRGNGHGSVSSKPSRSTYAAPTRIPEPAPAAPRESYAELLKKWGEGADDIEWDESQDPTLNLKSITSLRSQGELRRFNDDLEYLFSGLDAAQNVSIRRSSAVELINLLCGKPDLGGLGQQDGGQQDGSDAEDADIGVDEEDVEDPLASAQSADFLRKLKASDLISRLFDLFRGAEAGEGVDDVLDAVMAVYIAKLLRTASTAEPLTRERRVQLYRTLRDLLTRADRDQRQDRKDGFALLRLHELKQLKIASKSNRKTLTDLRDTARISKLFVNGSRSWTLRNLVLAACCSLISLPRRLLPEAAIGDLLVEAEGSEDRSDTSVFAAVLNVLVSEGLKAKQRLSDFAKGLEILASAVVEVIPDLETIDVCIRFLDKGMDILYLELDRTVPASGGTLDALQHLIGFAIQAAPFGILSATDNAHAVSKSGTKRRALQILHGLFKLLLDLSQVDADWSESLASSRILQESVVRAFSLGYHRASQSRKPVPPVNRLKHGKGKQRDVEHVADDDAQKLDVTLFDDVVHLSLALLTNLLIKQLDKARDTLESIQLDPTCWRRRACATTCMCDTRLPALKLLARIFFETRMAAASDDDSNAAYLSNSIATAIAQYAVGGAARLKTCRAALDAELPRSKLGGKVGVANVIREDGFQTLLDAVEEFAVVHEAALHAERTQAAEADAVAGVVDVDVEMEMDKTDGDAAEPVAEAVDAPGDGSNSVAVEAGQLIKDLAVSLRKMA